MIRIAMLLVLCWLAPVPGHCEMLTYSRSFVFDYISYFEDRFVVPGFDPALGQLTDVRLQAVLDVNPSSMVFYPLAGYALELTGALEPILQLHQPNADRNRPIQTIPVLLPMPVRQPFLVSLPPLWGATTVLTEPAHGEGLARACCEAFVGAEVALPVSLVGLSSYTPHEWVSVRQIEGAARLAVTLEYEFSVVPEPATVLLVLTPLVVIVGRVTIRRRSPNAGVVVLPRSGTARRPH